MAPFASARDAAAPPDNGCRGGAARGRACHGAWLRGARSVASAARRHTRHRSGGGRGGGGGGGGRTASSRVVLERLVRARIEVRHLGCAVDRGIVRTHALRALRKAARVLHTRRLVRASVTAGLAASAVAPAPRGDSARARTNA